MSTGTTIPRGRIMNGLLEKFTEKKNEALRQYLDSLFAMRQETTPEEWKTLTR